MTDRPSPCCDDIDDGDRRTLLALLAGLGIGDAVLAQDATVMQPRAYRVALENDKLRVLEFNGRPGMAVCGDGMHSHPAHLTITLTPAKVRVKSPDGKTFVAEFKPGDVFWSEAETHETENLGGKDIRALLVELKPASAVKKA